jgi:hypothetical protein
MFKKSTSLITKFGKTLAKPFPLLSVVKNVPVNYSFSSWNKAIKPAKGLGFSSKYYFACKKYLIPLIYSLS